MDTYSPLAHAARYASVNVVSLLLKYDAELNGRGALAVTAQHGKADIENCETSSLETEEQDEHGTALNLVKKGRDDILKYLLERGRTAISRTTE